MCLFKCVCLRFCYVFTHVCVFQVYPCVSGLAMCFRFSHVFTHMCVCFRFSHVFTHICVFQV